MSTAVGDGAAAATYRNECGTILDALGLDEACLRLPSCLAAGGTVDEPPTVLLRT
jgi:hypothetical protein